MLNSRRLVLMITPSEARGGTRLAREPHRPPTNEHGPILRIRISALCGRDETHHPHQHHPECGALARGHGLTNGGTILLHSRLC